MNDNSLSNFPKAVRDFREARRQYALQEIIGRLTGRPTDLLSFDEIKSRVPLSNPSHKRLEDVPIESIVGSVGRYEDFNRKFLPRMDEDVDRWARVKVAFETQGLEPIEVYKIDQVYFVLDGNHRVSIARQLDAPSIEAWVIEYPTPIELRPTDRLDDVLLKAERLGFLSETRIKDVNPEVEIEVTVPGGYPQLTEHIQVHRYFLGLEKGRDIGIEEAVRSWLDRVYLPFIRLIRYHGVLREFPGRTEADLYLWLKKHLVQLSQQLGWNIDEERAVLFLSRELSARPIRVLRRIRDRITNRLLPDELAPGPRAGEWRLPEENPRFEDRLFSSILVPVGDKEASWMALEQALPVAIREEASIKGLFVIPPQAPYDSEKIRSVMDGFDLRCREAGIEGELVVERGRVSDVIVSRAAWNDLVVMHLAHPPLPNPISRYRSGFRSVVQRSPRPVLAVPQSARKLEKTLLAYDGSPKAEEALFLSAYLAKYWNTSLIVLSSDKTQQRARQYLEEQNIDAIFVRGQGNPGALINQTADEHVVDLIVLGGYGHRPVRAMLFGSALEVVLRSMKRPVLICR